MKPVVPANEKGKALDLEHSVEKESLEEAKKLYLLACERLLQPWQWHELSGKLTAEFIVKEQRQLKIGDYIQIDIPAPGSDWVRVKNIEEDFIAEADHSLALTLVVSKKPRENSGDVDHFFDDGATSTFVLNQKGTKITASYHGRNETPNTQADSLGKVVRNIVVALGAIVGLSDLQWMALLKGLLSDEDPGPTD